MGVRLTDEQAEETIKSLQDLSPEDLYGIAYNALRIAMAQSVGGDALSVEMIRAAHQYCTLFSLGQAIARMLNEAEGGEGA